MDEPEIKMKIKSKKTINWFMDISVADKSKITFYKN
ncbi:MAG: hypothetical protein JWQ54_1501 [Mucilaginibacter sp.]|nr:hypothetical protein [Mucilaginibacter sp.]